MDDEEEYDDREKLFHSTVREYIIYFLLFLLLFILSYTIIDYFRRKDIEDYFSTDEDEATVYKVSLHLSVFALSVAICAVLLHPFSIVSNEVLLSYPRSYYVKWLNHSLIQGIWNLVFLFSNLSLFGLLPFSYLFTESEGLSGCRKSVKSRFYETCTVLLLLILISVGLSFVISALVNLEGYRLQIFSSLGISYLPLLYSCMSFIGVVLLILCTPLGFIKMFGVLSRFLVKPQFLQNINDEYFATVMEEELLERRLKQVMATGKSYIKPEPMCIPKHDNGEAIDIMALQNGALQIGLKEKLDKVQKTKEILEKQRATSSMHRNVVYPVAMLALLALTAITILLVLVNSLQLLIGIKALPKSTAQFTLGLTSLSKLGSLGASIEVVVIVYLAVASLVGLYTFPFLAKIRPRAHRTPLSLLIANCALLLILSSALPLLCRILGITNVDLLGHFGNIEWLGNFKIVFTYNIIFAGVTSLCLINLLTAPVCKEFYNRVRNFIAVLKESKEKFHPPIILPSANKPPVKED
ncbi:unnamed protein product [Nezara viridula]|uniref:Uncharacterized protein n=1 Tax=Nezara viridula TaxID=85310 RepID=A0A9P0HPU7_NEZVI|nr:unnamed protein product [Nezara viridula]